MLEKWKRAVIHLECATDSEHFYDRIKRVDEQRALLGQGQITHEQFAEEIAGRSRDIRFHGTALFLAHANRRYLLTARHVVWDERSAKRELEEEAQRLLTWPENMRQNLLQSAIERAQNKIFNIIFRVPSFDEVLAKRGNREFLMNLGAGASFTVPYTFSDPGLDLALISLDQRDSRFANELTALGFVPITSSDIADGPESEGQEVFTIGFPSSTALIGQVSQHPASAHWSSSHFSLPVSSFGRVSMIHSALPFFWADMSIYPGNSGGPVIANDQLVGVVSAQATLPIDGVPDVRTRIPFGRIIKTSFVRALLEVQAQKDQR
jgi:hypothetical protein